MLTVLRKSIIYSHSLVKIGLIKLIISFGSTISKFPQKMLVKICKIPKILTLQNVKPLVDDIIF